MDEFGLPADNLGFPEVDSGPPKYDLGPLQDDFGPPESWALQKDDTNLLERYWLFLSKTGHCYLQSDIGAHEERE